MALFFELYYLLPLFTITPLVYFGLFSFEKLYYFAVFATPFSLNLEKIVPGLGFNLSLPSELFLSFLFFILLIKLIEGKLFEIKIFTHPISIAVLFYLFWMFVTSISSSMPQVSFKHFLAQCWFVFPLFFLPMLLFRKKNNILLFFALYIIPFTGVILYSIKKHLSFGLFDKDAGNFVMQPFYNDHTSYGAIIAMFLPVLIGMLFYRNIKVYVKVFIALLAVLFSVALILSYTRAAWISFLGAVILSAFMVLRIKIRYVAVIALAAISLLFIYRIEIIDKLSKNKQDSSAELSAHIKSISNIATDASNRERINRWNCALKMFKERPLLGWGPGTYMFQYAGFQMARDKTIISTNFGEGGNAHSEYIGPLAEQGFMGLITISGIVLTFFLYAFRLYYRLSRSEDRLLVLICIASLSTYFIHGLLNNYLDTDKASVPFWGFMAIICSLDIYTQKKNPQLGGAEER